MKKVFAVAAVVGLSVNMGVLAAGFDRQIEVVKVSGTSSATQPGSSRPVELAEGASLQYGTVIDTEADSSVVLKFSEGNGCRVFALTKLAILEDDNDRSTKVVELRNEGGVRVILDSSYRSDNVMRVKTPVATVEALACDFTVEYRMVSELQTAFVSDSEGEIAINGQYYTVPSLQPGEQVTVAASPDGKFIRIKIVQGNVEIGVFDSEGAQRKIQLSTGDSVQILIEEMKDNPGMMTVIYKIDYADGRESEVIQSSISSSSAAAVTSTAEEQRPHGTVAPIRNWPLLTVQPPTAISYTPPGQR